MIRDRPKGNITFAILRK